MRMPDWFTNLGAPGTFYKFAGRLIPWLAGLAALSFVIGAYGGLVLAPPDYQQGDGYRIIFIHVPAAWMSMFIYVLMAFWGALVLIWRAKIAAALMVSAATLGASFTAITLATGSLWGKPMWGTWWAWDARLTSELVLLFLYIGFIAMQQALPARPQSRRAGAVLLLVGVVNIPIIHYSVQWWNTLHQPATITKFGAPSIAFEMLWPLLVMAISFMAFFAAACLWRTRAELLLNEVYSRWTYQLTNG